MGSHVWPTPRGSVRQRQPPSTTNFSRQPTNDTYQASRGPPTLSHASSGGAQGQGPPTLSCSGDHSNDTSSVAASVPLTNEEMESPPQSMGRVGPGPRPRSPYTLSSSDTESDPHRPMITIKDAHPDAMSMLSDPTMMEFGASESFAASGAEWTNTGTQPSINRQSHSTYRGSQRDPRRSSTDRLSQSTHRLSAEHSSSSMAEKFTSHRAVSDNMDSSMALRNSNVDKMVMEALREAQEARGTGIHTPAGAHHGKLREEMKDLMMRRSGSRESTAASRPSSQSSRNFQSLHHTRKQPPPPPVHHWSDPSQNSLSPHTSSGESTISSRNNRRMVPGSIHSFYSRSGATSYETGGAFDC